VLLVGIAATGAYFGGLLDRPHRDGSAEPSPPPETAAPPEAGNSAGEQAGEESPPQATPPPENPPPGTGDAVVAPPAEEPLPTPPAETENEPAAPPPSTDPDATPPSPGPVSPPPEPPEQISEIADQISWLRTYSGGDCFYVAVTSATGKAIGIEGFGSTVQPFMDMLEAFRSKFQVEPSVGVRLIDPVQCPVTGFLHDIGESMSTAPQLTLDRTFIATGTPISGELEIPAGQKIHLLLIDHKGMVFNLDQRVDLKFGKASFSIPIGLGAADQTDANGVPLVLIALASDSDIQAAALQAPEPAAKALSSILTEMQTRKLTASATAKYFRLKP
jgi:hypothetical protein